LKQNEKEKKRGKGGGILKLIGHFFSHNATTNRQQAKPKSSM
jgi:hypothetical protein